MHSSLIIFLIFFFYVHQVLRSKNIYIEFGHADILLFEVKFVRMAIN
jgi:hypothetical protein